MEFLTEEYSKGSSFSSLNGYRSAIGLLYSPDLAEDPLLKRFFNAVSKERPPLPRYEVTWAPNLVLDELKQWGPNEELALDKLSWKLILLLALVTGHRVQTFSLIKIQNIEEKEDRLEIKITERIKTSKVKENRLVLPTLVLPFFQEDVLICPATTLQFYLRKTEQLRGQEEKLFIACKRPFKKVTTQTLSRWIKEGLKMSAIDAELFSAHSTRCGDIGIP